jgi:hypothetical protein
MSEGLQGFSLQPSGDLEIVNGSWRVVDGAEYARQKVSVRCQFFLGEWFLNAKEGVPYFRDVLIKNPNPDTVRSVFRNTILSVPGIVEVNSLKYSLNSKTRVATITFQATYQGGQPEPVSLEFVL